MKLQLPDAPALKQFRASIPAEFYNPIRLALLRRREPVDLVLGGRGLHAFFHDHAWLVSDRNLADTPVLVWTDFRLAQRQGVHHSVPCILKYYHAYAAVIVRTVLPDVLQRLVPKTPPRIRSARVLPFHLHLDR